MEMKMRMIGSGSIHSCNTFECPECDYMRKKISSSTPDLLSVNIKEGNETISIKGCKMTCIKESVNQKGAIVQKEISIKDLGIQKRNGHCYRIYDIKEVDYL